MLFLMKLHSFILHDYNRSVCHTNIYFNEDCYETKGRIKLEIQGLLSRKEYHMIIKNKCLKRILKIQHLSNMNLSTVELVPIVCL